MATNQTTPNATLRRMLAAVDALEAAAPGPDREYARLRSAIKRWAFTKDATALREAA